MTGVELFISLSRKFAPSPGRVATRRQLSNILGVSEQTLWLWKNNSRKSITGRQIANLIAKTSTTARKAVEKLAVEPIVEFLSLEPARSTHGMLTELFSPRSTREHPYLRGLCKQLKQCHGIYIFYDSRGRALYVGKAEKLTLWNEMKSAFNRKREIQSIKRVRHPARRILFRKATEKVRQILRQQVKLHDLAVYMSAYSVPQGLIGSLESLLGSGPIKVLADRFIG